MARLFDYPRDNEHENRETRSPREYADTLFTIDYILTRANAAIRAPKRRPDFGPGAEDWREFEEDFDAETERIENYSDEECR